MQQQLVEHTDKGTIRVTSYPKLGGSWLALYGVEVELPDGRLLSPQVVGGEVRYESEEDALEAGADLLESATKYFS